MTRSGKRDTARVIEIRFYFDKHCKEAYFSLVDCLSPTLRLTSPFPLFQLEESDQIVQINSTDVRQCSPEQFRLILEGISLNEWSSGDAPKPPTKDQLQFLTYIKGKDLEPQKHLSKDQPVPTITEHWAFCDRCQPNQLIHLPEPSRFLSRHAHTKARTSNDKCKFGIAMQTSPLKLQGHECDGVNFTLGNFTTKIKEPYGTQFYEEYKLILLRSGMDPDDDQSKNIEICSIHRKLLGKDFLLHVHKRDCYHVNHKLPYVDKGERMITYEEAISFRKCTFLTLPCGLPMCNKCYSDVVAAMDTEVMDSEPTGLSSDSLEHPTPINRRLLDLSFTPEGNTGDVQSSQSSSSSANTLPSKIKKSELKGLDSKLIMSTSRSQNPQEILENEQIGDADQTLQSIINESHSNEAPDDNIAKRRLKAFNAFLELCGLEALPARYRYVDVSFENSDDYSRKRKVLKGLSRGIYAMLLSVTENESDRIFIWNKLKEAGLVENLLDKDPKVSADLREIVHACNAAAKPVRIQILSTIVKNYTYAELNKFNRKPEIVDEDEEPETEIETEGLFFTFHFSRYLYNKALDHYDTFKHGMEEVVRNPIAHWSFDQKTVDGIIHFINSPDITQQVAFGSRLIDDPSGGKTAIAKVTRRFTNSEVTRQIQTYLEEINFPEPHPCPRTIMRMLENMKATISKSLKGICPSHENCSRAFSSVSSILSELKKMPELYDYVIPEDYDVLTKIADTCKVYIKNVFRYQLNSKHSSVRSHCVSYGCSAPNDKKFSSLLFCKYQEDMMDTDDLDSENEGASAHKGDGCDYCEAVPTLFKVITGIVRKMEGHLSPTKLPQMIYNLQRSEFHINAFKGTLMQDNLSRRQWNQFSKLEQKGQATLVVDFPMKYEPKRRKEKTDEWYAKSAFSWFIGVFTRKIKVDNEDHFQTTKYICIVDQGSEDGPKRQEQSMVVAIMNKMIRHYKDANSDLTDLFVKSDNASNLKNEVVVSFLNSFRYCGENGGPELKVVHYMNNAPGYGKDSCDPSGALAKAKVEKEVNSMVMDADNPKNFANALVHGNGIINSVIMLGPIVGFQAKLGDDQRRISAITKLHDFEFTQDGVTIRRCCKIGEGEDVTLEPLTITTEYHAEVVNSHHLENGRPKYSSSKPVMQSNSNNKQKKSQDGKKNERLNMYEYIRKSYIQTWGMETLEELQPDIQIGGKVLLQKMDLPKFPQSLLELSCETKYSELHSTLQGSLPVGYALPVWGEGRNPVTKEAKAFIQDLFQKGQVGKPIPAADAMIMMQNKTDGEGVPLFDETTYLDESQIKSIFGTTSRKLKRSLNDPDPKGSSSSKRSKEVIGIDRDDEDNGEEKQEFEQKLADYEMVDYEATLQKDSDNIREDLERTAFESDEHPIKIAGIDICQIAERITMHLNVDTLLAEFTKKQNDTIFSKLEDFEKEFSDEPLPKRKRTKKRKSDLIFQHVKRNCTCVAFSR